MRICICLLFQHLLHTYLLTYMRTVETTAEGTPFLGSMNVALCRPLICSALEKHFCWDACFYSFFCHCPSGHVLDSVCLSVCQQDELSWNFTWSRPWYDRQSTASRPGSGNCFCPCLHVIF